MGQTAVPRLGVPKSAVACDRDAPASEPAICASPKIICHDLPLHHHHIDNNTNDGLNRGD